MWRRGAMQSWKCRFWTCANERVWTSVKLRSHALKFKGNGPLYPVWAQQRRKLGVDIFFWSSWGSSTSSLESVTHFQEKNLQPINISAPSLHRWGNGGLSRLWRTYSMTHSRAACAKLYQYVVMTNMSSWLIWYHNWYVIITDMSSVMYYCTCCTRAACARL